MRVCVYARTFSPACLFHSVFTHGWSCSLGEAAGCACVSHKRCGLKHICFTHVRVRRTCVCARARAHTRAHTLIYIINVRVLVVADAVLGPAILIGSRPRRHGSRRPVPTQGTSVWGCERLPTQAVRALEEGQTRTYHASRHVPVVRRREGSVEVSRASTWCGVWWWVGAWRNLLYVDQGPPPLDIQN